MIQQEFTTNELIIATITSLKKWKNISIETLTEKCGFCYLSPDDSYCSEGICPAHDICEENSKFWFKIHINPRKSFNPGKYKYQQRRIQKNIDWLKDYLMKLRAKILTIQCRMCEAGEYNSLDDLKDHLEKEHKLTEDDLIQYGGDFSDDIELLIYKEKRSVLSDEARERCAGALGLK